MSLRYVSFVILFLYTLLMNITDSRLCQTKEKDNRVSMMLLDPRVCFFVLLYAYFLSSTAALSTTTSATTADHDDHDKGLKTRPSPLVFSHFNPHSYHHIGVSGCDCYYQQRHTTSGATVRAPFFPSFRLFICAYIWIFIPHIFRSG